MIHIALLRAVNLGSHNKIGMPALRALLEELGFEDVRTLLQSGNVVFRSAQRKPAALEATLESEAASRVGLMTDFFVRTATEWQDIVGSNPFPAEARADPSHLQVLLFKAAPSRAAIRVLADAIPGRERLHAAGRHAYVVYPDGIGRSRLTTALIERKLGVRTTGRNWNTVLKLAALADA